MRLYLATTPDKLQTASGFTRTLAHVAYGIGQDGQFLRRNLLRTRGGLMVLSDRNCGAVSNPGLFCRGVWQECAGRDFGGLVADFELPPSPDRIALLRQLAPLLLRNGRLLFVPESYGRHIPQAQVLICTAISGGTLTERLEEARQTYGSRLALDLQRLRMAFPLPCPSGEGEPLTDTALRQLMEQRQPAVFYSADLCAKYFTDTKNEKSRFILFDDADTLMKKIRIGQSMGITAGFLMYPETEDLLDEIFPRPAR